jgi:hypothetical protein
MRPAPLAEAPTQKMRIDPGSLRVVKWMPERP